MKAWIGLALAVTLAANVDAAQPPSPSPGAQPEPAKPARPVRRAERPKRDARYGQGMPITAGDPDGVRINSAGEVLFDRH